MWMLGLIVLYLLAAEIFVAWRARSFGLHTFDVILLLGCNGNPQSPLTLDRAEHAIKAKKKWPTARLIISGNEKRNEISVFARMLAEARIEVAAADGESLNTWDNMQKSSRLISAEENVLLVTSNFHRKRALAMARSVGFRMEALVASERKYKKGALYFIKERLSIYLNFPRMIFAKKTSKS